MKRLVSYYDGDKMASLKFTEVSKFLYAHFNDEKCPADIASNVLQTSDVYQSQEVENSNVQSEAEPIIRTLVENIRITF